MTTIAYRNGIMASDSIVTTSDYIVGMTPKVMRFRNGCLFGAAGDADTRAIEKMLSGIKTPRSMPTGKQLAALEVCADCIMVWPNGQVFQIDINCPDDTKQWKGSVYETTGPYFAIGSGFQFALTAMRLGKSAAEAVEIAAEFDLKTGGPVQTVRLVSRGKRKRK